MSDPTNAMPTPESGPDPERPAIERTPGPEGQLEDRYIGERCDPAPAPETEGR